ncbi:LysE family translocator [Curvivirga sp.]|uniref:LysE family translocator n=1 Tax=Curvivirga sp. TaxID=2856848 RepID=UPI003B5A96AB
MTVEMIFALMGFAFVMSISPGPGNFMLLASGVNFGFFKSLPLIFGISVGFLSMVLGVGLGLGQILEKYPFIYTVLRIICGLYVFWIAFRIATCRSIGDGKSELSKPISFMQAAFFQLLNPKAWAVALIVTVSYTVPEDYIGNLIFLIVLFAIVNIPTISIWALSGVVLHRFLSYGNRTTIFNLTMAVLLVGSMIPMILN